MAVISGGDIPALASCLSYKLTAKVAGTASYEEMFITHSFVDTDARGCCCTGAEVLQLYLWNCNASALPKDMTDTFQCFFYIVSADAIVGHSADVAFAHSAHQDAVLAQARKKFICIWCIIYQRKVDDISLDASQVNMQLWEGSQASARMRAFA